MNQPGTQPAWVTAKSMVARPSAVSTYPQMARQVNVNTGLGVSLLDGFGIDADAMIADETLRPCHGGRVQQAMVLPFGPKGVRCLSDGGFLTFP